MHKLTLGKITGLLNKKIDDENFPLKDRLEEIETELLKHSEIKAVLGIDIYQYSKYQNLPQMLIPYFFKNIYETTIRRCLDLEPFIFEGLSPEIIRSRFIDTGDGGFQIFDNPFQALVFAIYFQLNISRYNSRDKSTKHIYDVIGEVTIRYAATFDNLYPYEKNYYGTSIINCARILSKDKLNRFLIDEKTKTWFNHNFNGIETLMDFIMVEDYEFIEIFSQRETRDIKTLIFNDEKNKINQIDLLKIGEITSKSNTVSIYNLHLQVSVSSPASSYRKYNVSLGNLNTSGLAE